MTDRLIAIIRRPWVPDAVWCYSDGALCVTPLDDADHPIVAPLASLTAATPGLIDLAWRAWSRAWSSAVDAARRDAATEAHMRAVYDAAADLRAAIASLLTAHDFARACSIWRQAVESVEPPDLDAARRQLLALVVGPAPRVEPCAPLERGDE